MSGVSVVIAVMLVAAGTGQAKNASIKVDDVKVEWQAQRGMSIYYAGSQAFRPYADEFTVHDRAWKRNFYSTRRGRSTGRIVRSRREHVLEIVDNDGRFFYRKRVTVKPGARIIEEFEYGQRGLGDDVALQLGWKPVVAWLDGAAYTVVAGGKRQEGVIPRGYSGKRVLFSSLTEAEFRSILGVMRIRSTHPMTLYDYRRSGEFWLGWDTPLEEGKVYAERVEISFQPGSVEAGGIRVSRARWSRQVEDGYFAFSAEVSRAKGGPEAARLEVEVAERGAKGQTVARRRQVLDLRRRQKIDVRVPLPEPGHYVARIKIADAAGKELLGLPELAVDVAKILSAVPGVSPYTSERQGEIIVRIAETVPLNGCSVVVGGRDFPRREMKPDGREVVVPFDLAPLANGLHQVDVRLLRGRDVIGHTTARFVKAPPAAHEVKIDYRTRGLIVDGRPFFPFGFYTHNGRFYDTYTAKLLPDLEAPFKFNLIAPYHNFNWDDRVKFRPQIRKFLDRCRDVGMMMHYDIRALTDQPISEENWKQIADEINAMKDHPAVLCWYLSDEPAGRGLSADRFVDRYPRLKQLDPYHPTTIVFCVPHKAPEYLKGFDIIMVDPYPIPNSSVVTVANTVDLVLRDSGGEMPVWCVPQAFGGGEWWGREPTPAEERCMTYLAIVHGATGIQYFIRRPPHNNPFVPQLWGEIRRMAQEIRELTPVLLSHESRPKVEVVEPEGQVHAAAWAYKGRVVVIAVNTQAQPATMTLRCSAQASDRRADVLWEQRTVPVSDAGEITDIIDGFGVRIYQLWTGPRPDYAMPGNLLHNGSFEQQTNVGYPDYFYVGQGQDFAASWGTDSREAHHGDHSLFIRCPTDGKGPGVISYPMRLKPGRYQLTAWVKYDRDGASAKIGVKGFKNAPLRDVKVGSQWQQVTVEFEVPPKTRWVHAYFEALSKGVLWVDEAFVRPAGQQAG